MAPSWAKSPKSFRKTVKEWETMANEHFKEQADSVTDFAIKSQEKACEQIPEKKEDDEEKKDADKAKDEAKAEHKQAAAKDAKEAK